MENDFINWWEFSPTNDLMLVRVQTKTEEKTESGIITNVKQSVVQDRPTEGLVVSTGPSAPFSAGTYLYYTKTSGYDFAQIRSENSEMYTILHPEAILGTKVKDTRC